MTDPNIDLVSQEVLIDAVNHPGELGDEIIREAVAKFQTLSSEAQQLFLEELKRKSDDS